MPAASLLAPPTAAIAAAVKVAGLTLIDGQATWASMHIVALHLRCGGCVQVGP